VTDFAAIGAFASGGLDRFLGLNGLGFDRLYWFGASALAVSENAAVGAFAMDGLGHLGGVTSATVVADFAAVGARVGRGLGHVVCGQDEFC
tara:strand:- start:136 stop:408 length:273 start_codon:yes stop_codon:yes gene_type:complete